MSIPNPKEYVFQYDNKPHIALKNSDKIIEISRVTDNLIMIRNGINLYSSSIFKGSITGDIENVEVTLEYNCYTAKEWKRKCLLQIILPNED
jgi:hypothetical protein